MTSSRATPRWPPSPVGWRRSSSLPPSSGVALARARSGWRTSATIAAPTRRAAAQSSAFAPALRGA
jgi:hypothetical protein